MEVNIFKLLWEIQKNNFKIAFASKVDAITNILLMILNNFLFIFMWWVLFYSKKTINGWDFSNVLLMSAVTNFSFGIYAVFFRGAEALPQYIENGSLDNFLTSPRNSLFMVAVSESTYINWGDFFTGIILLIMSGYCSFINIILFFILCMACSAIFFSFRLIVSCISFFKDGMDRLGDNLFMSFLIFTSIPASVFTGWYKVIFLSIIPAGFISLVPVNIITDFSVVFFLGLIFFSFFILAISIGLFFIGLKNYTSGNKFGVR